MPVIETVNDVVVVEVTDTHLTIELGSAGQLLAGTGLEGGGPLNQTVTISLNTASQASLALADTALQDADIGVTVQAHNTNLDAYAAANAPSEFMLNLVDLPDAPSWQTQLEVYSNDQVDALLAALSSVYQVIDPQLTAYAGGDTPSAFTLGIVDSVDAAAWRTALGIPEYDVFTDTVNGLVPASGGGTTKFLRADGTFAIPSGSAGGNPTVEVGLTAVNGTDGAYMRANAAPALSQAIVPTWTGLHTFANASGLEVSRAGQALLTLRDTSAGTNEKGWQLRNTAGQFDLYPLTDANAAASSAFRITRTGTVINTVNFPNGTLQSGGNLVPNVTSSPTWTGSHTFNAELIASGGSSAAAAVQATRAANDVYYRATTQGVSDWSFGNRRSDGAFVFSSGTTLGSSVAVLTTGGALTLNGNAVPNVTSSPTWTGDHVFTDASYAVTLDSSFPAVTWIQSTAAADNRRWDIVASSETFRIRTVNDAASVASNILSVERTGTTVDSVTVNATTVRLNGLVDIGPAAAMKIRGSTNTTSQTNYISLQTSAGSEQGWVGFGSGTSTMAVANNIGALTFSASTSFSWSNGSTLLTLGSTGSLGFGNSVWHTSISDSANRLYFAYNSHTYISAPSGAAIYLRPNNSATETFGFDGTTTSSMRMQGRVAIFDAADGWLRLNNSGSYTNGVYTPGLMRADGGLGFSLSSSITSNGSSTYGNMLVSATKGGYHGVTLNTTGFPSFMSDGTYAGIYIEGDGRWLITRWLSTTAYSSYNLQAPSFQISSSRKLKDETGSLSAKEATAILDKLRPIKYRLKADPDNEQIGLIAEEVHEVCPWLSPDGTAVMYDRIAMLLLAERNGVH
jgi:hypothetical protein